MMDITRKTVNEWLTEHRRKREWLAKTCGVTLSAVGMWLNKKGNPVPIPSKHQILINNLMERDKAEKGAKAPPAPPIQNLILYPTRAQFNSWNAAYKHSEAETLEDWASEGLDRKAKPWIYNQGFKVAEDTPQYGAPPQVLPPPEPEDGNGTEGK
jgi:hypothetical protein